jgi:hypothetical protein
MGQKMARENYESGYVPRNPATQMGSFCQRCSENAPAVCGTGLAAPDSQVGGKKFIDYKNLAKLGGKYDGRR